MLVDTLRIIRVLALIPSLASCQEQEPLRIANRPEAVQRRFLAEYLNEGLPLGYRQFNGNVIDPIGELGIMTRTQYWVVPVLEQRAKEAMKDLV